MTEQTKTPLEQFTEYFVQNYPGPNTIIANPNWHAPKIFRAAEHAIGLRQLETELSTQSALLADMRAALEAMYEQCDSLEDFKFTRDLPPHEAQQNWDDARYAARKVLARAADIGGA